MHKLRCDNVRLNFLSNLFTIHVPIFDILCPVLHIQKTLPPIGKSYHSLVIAILRPKLGPVWDQIRTRLILIWGQIIELIL